MKKIAIIAMATALKGEKGYTRFDFLADMLSKNGYEIDLITSSFQHWEKKQRNKKTISAIENNYNVVLIDEPGYEKNVDLKRVFSHHILGKNLKRYLIENPKYDLFYCIIPPNNTAKIAGEIAARLGTPFIIDVEDLWPEAMKMIFGVPVISDLLYWPLEKSAKEAYKLANGIIGTSDEYRDRPFKNRSKNIDNYTVYVGINLNAFDQGAAKFMPEIEKKKDEFWVTYAGTLGTSYDIRTLIDAAEIMKNKGYQSVKIKILGNGPMKEELEKRARSINCNVDFLGYMQFEKMAAYLKKSDVLVNSFVKKAPQSIVNKIGDYLAAGKPMINTCSSQEFRKKVEFDGFGVNVVAEDAKVLSEAIEKLFLDPDYCNEMGIKARKIAEMQFDRSASYKKIEELIEKLVTK